MAMKKAGQSAEGACARDGCIMAGSKMPSTSSGMKVGNVPQNKVGGTGSGLFNHPKKAGSGKK